jgi:hypothetical protein
MPWSSRRVRSLMTAGELEGVEVVLLLLEDARVSRAFTCRLS